MTKDCQAYLECYGLNRLVLCALASLLRERNSKDRLKRAIVSKRCRLEATERGEPKFTPTAIRTALDTTIKLKWVEESSGFIRLSDLGWRVYGHDLNGASLAPSPSSVTKSANDSCRLILGTLTEIKKQERYIYDPRINRQGELTIRELRTWAAMYGVSEEFFWRTLGGLLAKQIVRVVPTGPDENLSLVSVTKAGLHAKAPSLETNPLLDVEVILNYLHPTEEDANKRVTRIPEKRARELARNFLVRNSGPYFGVSLEDLMVFTMRIFPGIPMQPKRSDGITDIWDIPKQLQKATGLVSPVEIDPKKPCSVREYFAGSPFPTMSPFGSYIIELLESNRLRVAEFRAVSNDVHGSVGPVLRISLSGAAQALDGIQVSMQEETALESGNPKHGQATQRRKVAKRISRITPDMKHMDAYKFHLAGKTYREIGIELGISHETARQWVSLAKQYAGDQHKARSVSANKLPSDNRGQPTV